MYKKITEEEFTKYYQSILADLPSICWSKTNIGRGNVENPEHLEIRIIPVDVENVHIRVDFFSIYEGGHRMSTKNPIMTEYEVIARQLVVLGVRDISDFDWHLL